MQTNSRHAVLAGFLGWTLDAFDFFVVVFLYDDLAAAFHVDKKLIIATTAFTLAFRPVGALIFGTLADRFGRRGAGAARALHQIESAGVGSVAREARGDDGRHVPQRERSRERIRVSRAADDVHDVPVARHAGPLSRFPEVARHRIEDGSVRRD